MSTTVKVKKAKISPDGEKCPAIPRASTAGGAEAGRAQGPQSQLHVGRRHCSRGHGPLEVSTPLPGAALLLAGKLLLPRVPVRIHLPFSLAGSYSRGRH